MVKVIFGNERDIEDKINDCLNESPDYESQVAVTPYNTVRGVMFCAVVELFAPIIISTLEETKPPENEEETENGDTTDIPAKTDGKGKKTT